MWSSARLLKFQHGLGLGYGTCIDFWFDAWGCENRRLLCSCCLENLVTNEWLLSGQNGVVNMLYRCVIAFISLSAKLSKFFCGKRMNKQAFSYADCREEPKFITERTKRYAK